MTKPNDQLYNLLALVHKYAWEIGIYSAVLLLVGSFAVYIEDAGLMRVFVDQNAHLNIARQMSDSLTPGMSQLGFWPPLLHLLMAIPAMFDSLYTSGYAGVVAIAPVVALGAVALYRLALHLTSHRPISLVAVGLFVLNPYFLYYAATPMTESLFVSLLFIVAYWTIRWMESESLTHLMYVGIAAALLSLARFEGLLLVPVLASIVAITLHARRHISEKIEAAVILFLFVAALGGVAILLNGWIYAENPLEFANGRWSAAAQQAGDIMVSRGNISESLAFATGSAVFMLSAPLVVLTCISLFVTAFVADGKRRPQLATLCAIMCAPMAFVVFALYRGDAFIALPVLPPHEGFYNERYGLQALGFLAVAILAGSATLGARLRLIPSASRIAPIAAFSVVLFAAGVQAAFLSKTVLLDDLAIVRSTIPTSFVPYEEDAGRVLAQNYDGGSILITRGLNHAVGVVAGIPLKNYIYESNVPHYEYALEAPWKYARFVVIQNQQSEWREQNEFIAKWKYSSEFNERYELLFENHASRIYKLRTEDTVSPSLSFAL